MFLELPVSRLCFVCRLILKTEKSADGVHVTVNVYGCALTIHPRTYLLGWLSDVFKFFSQHSKKGRVSPKIESWGIVLKVRRSGTGVSLPCGDMLEAACCTMGGPPQFAVHKPAASACACVCPHVPTDLVCWVLSLICPTLKASKCVTLMPNFSSSLEPSRTF